MRSLTPEVRDAIDLRLVDVCRAAWEVGTAPQLRLLRAAYLQGRVDQENGRALQGVKTSVSKLSKERL